MVARFWPDLPGKNGEKTVVLAPGRPTAQAGSRWPVLRLTETTDPGPVLAEAQRYRMHPVAAATNTNLASQRSG